VRRYALIVLALVACKRVGPGIPAAAASDHGAQLYGKLCALCHGDEREGGKADNAPSLASPTLLASASDDFLRASIARGRPGTAMAGYGKEVGGPLAPADVDAMIAYLRAGGPPRAVLHAPPPGQAGDGKQVYDHACATCHGRPGQRGIAVYLASPVFLASASDEFLAYAITNGRPGTKMDPWRDKLTPQQLADIVSYLRSLAAPVAAPPPSEPKVPDDLPIVLNPTGPAPSFPPLKEDRYVPAADVKAAMDKGAKLIVVDARPPSDWLRVHIPGAISIPYYDMKMIDKLPNDGTWVLTYCACPHHASGIVLDELRKRGFKNSAVIDEGILGWQRAGYPAVDVDGKPAAVPPGLPGATPIGPAPGLPNPR
jgi:cytochrome c oxidase cbb3-type subunit 3/ubiquinol-cytochrome c reductase cytochrome c subunit